MGNRWDQHAVRELLRRDLCAKHCSYYKPSKGEEPACLGFTLTGRLIEAGLEIPFEKISDEPVKGEKGRKLLRAICSKCPFYENDCDFAAGAEGGSPCAGFVVLLSLVACGVVSLNDICGKI